MYIPNLLAFLIAIQYVNCANILYVAPVASPSHHIWNRELALALIQKGHNITMIGHDADKTKTKNLNVILFEGVYEKLYAEFKIEDMFTQYPIVWLKDMYDFLELLCKLDFETEGLKTILNYPQDAFDIVLFDATFGQCLYPIIDHFKRPVVGVTPFLLPNYLSNAMGNHWYTSYMPHYSLAATDRMSFFERIASFFFTRLELFIRNYYYMGKYEKQAKKYFGEQIRPLHKYEEEFTLLLSNTDPFLDFPIALPPNIIPVGGLHAHPAKPLPNDIKEIMSTAKDGIILFSLGTNVRSDKLPKEIRANIIKALGKLKQTVLWKFETEIDGLPNNVIVRKWLPQNDILGHPNTKLFISHGGALSSQEAMYHGVPVLGIPFFVDQHNNIGKFVARKLALSISHAQITTNDFYDKINELLTNPTYSKSMKQISKKYKDEPQTPSERAVFWIEHVLKHGPLDEFKLPTTDMNILQIYSLDVIAFFVCILAAHILLLTKLFKYVFCKKCSKKEKVN